MFSHDRLWVYGKALAFLSEVSTMLASWDKRHALVDELSRAAESIVLNLAQGARLRCGPVRLRSLDYSLGSALESAACLDIAWIKGLSSGEERDRQKQRLSEIARMLVGLRKGWEGSVLHENSRMYGEALPEGSPPTWFHHETLDVYQASLRFAEWLTSTPMGNDLTVRLHRDLDRVAAGIALNIAEGNGRYSQLDHRRFLDLAECSAVKAAALLDVGAATANWHEAELVPGKVILARIAAMLSRM